MTGWSLLTVQVDGRFTAAVRRPDATLVIPPQLSGYDGLAAMLADWEELEPALRELDVTGLPALTGATPAAPVRYPRKLIGVGPNYHDHVAEMGAPPIPPDAPPFFYFVPPSTTLVGDGEAILIPADPAMAVDWEAELAVVIGRGGRDLAAPDAFSHIAGYACFSDITARGLMRKAEPLAEPFTWDWASAKGLDTFCPMGPVTPAWFVPDPGALGIRCLVNGVVKQDSSTAKIIRGVPELVAEASRFWTLEPGDVIATGTPAGVGHPRGEHLSDGDTVRVEITGLAPLSNPVRVRTAAPGPKKRSTEVD
ncbi:MAG TPA: fumarylacetoacetate hydrolase family protein [Trebonia sp.]